MAIQPTSPTVASFAPAQSASSGKAGASKASDEVVQPLNRPGDARVAEETSQKATEPKAFDAEALREIVQQAQNALPPKARDITFSMDENAQSVVVKIFDGESQELIRQIPSEEFLKIAEALNEQIETIRSGLLLEQKA